MKPILFSTPMVQAILDGRKTQTRRICKHQFWSHSELTDFNVNKVHKKVDKNVSSKYQVGDILWVRETWNMCTRDMLAPGEFSIPRNDGLPRGEWVWVYKAESKEETHPDHPDWGKKRWKPSIFMPKEAARIFLEVTNIRVERLQDISESDAIAEGIDFYVNKWDEIRYKDYSQKYDKPNDDVPTFKSSAAIASFQSLWQSINGNWNENPWVFVYEFEIFNP